jgi:hypothetical protein
MRRTTPSTYSTPRPHPDGRCGYIFCLDARCRPLSRSAGGIDKADAARSEPSPVGDATTSVGRALTDDHGSSRECRNGPDSARL